jgi:hypothetical protein
VLVRIRLGGCRQAARREWLAHQHDARNNRGIEVIVDLGGVEARDWKGRKEGKEQARVSVSISADDLSQNGEQAGACGGLQHAIRWGDGGSRRVGPACVESASRIAGRSHSGLGCVWLPTIPSTVEFK